MNLENQKQTNEKTDEVFPFISAFNPNNPPGYHAIKNSVEVLKRNNVPVFQCNNSKRKPPNLKKLLTKAKFSNEEVGVRKS